MLLNSNNFLFNFDSFCLRFLDSIEMNAYYNIIISKGIMTLEDLLNSTRREINSFKLSKHETNKLIAAIEKHKMLHIKKNDDETLAHCSKSIKLDNCLNKNNTLQLNSFNNDILNLDSFFDTNMNNSNHLPSSAFQTSPYHGRRSKNLARFQVPDRDNMGNSCPSNVFPCRLPPFLLFP